MTYGYNKDGDIVSRGGTFDVTNLPAALASATYDANNRLTNWGGTTLAYDADGNLTGDGTNTYTWNTRNQLMAISGSSTASFVYDALGRRESKTINGTSTNFLYDGLNMEQELSGTTPTANYLTGANIDEVFSRSTSGATQSYLTDNLGSTLALTNSAGAISTSYSYEPYGNTTASGASSTNALQYTGRENDGDGLYYYRARYYNPAYGRFVSEDPIGFGGGLNAYAYNAGNPMNYMDPFGLWSLTVGGYAGVGAEVTFGNDSGNRFFTFRLGLGLGGGVSYDPYGGIPGPAPQNPCKSGVVLSASVQADANVGPLDASYEAGDARNYNNGESDFYHGPGFGLTNSPWGLHVGASVGAQFTGYSGRSP
ncbi:MAG: RHS repeat-associated core domain-containing protein [Gammaproteobacteria bacterium]